MIVLTILSPTSMVLSAFVGDFMMVTDLRCWWQNHYRGLFSLCWWFSQWFKSVTNILNRSSASQTCRQHVWSPTSITKIDVTSLSPQNFSVLTNSVQNVQWFAQFTLNQSIFIILCWPNKAAWHHSCLTLLATPGCCDEIDI